MRKTLTALLLATAVLVVACGGDSGSGDSASGSTVTTIVATEFAFDPSSFNLSADTDVELTLQNAGVVEHDIVVEELDDRMLVYANAGQTVTETVNLPAGSYTIYCSIPGHRQAGMEGSLTVQ